VLAAGPTTFGPPTYNSTIGFDIAIEPEKKAFTVGLSGFEAVLDIPQRPPIATRTFSLSLPVTAEPGTEIPLFFQGSLESSNGATGHLVVTINDQTTAINFKTTRKNLRRGSEIQSRGGRIRAAHDHCPDRRSGFQGERLRALVGDDHRLGRFQAEALGCPVGVAF
jgi:hypothetical protein